LGHVRGLHQVIAEKISSDGSDLEAGDGEETDGKENQTDQNFDERKSFFPQNHRSIHWMLILPVDGKTVMVLIPFVFPITMLPPFEDEFGLKKGLLAEKVLLLIVTPVGRVTVSPSGIHVASPDE